jgi:hypothetical protein
MSNHLKKDQSAPKPTKDRLAEDFLVAGAPRDMVDAAKSGRYDDYLSESATPIYDLVCDCTACGLTRIAALAKDGKYDGTKAEAEAWFKSPEGQSILRQFGT